MLVCDYCGNEIAAIRNGTPGHKWVSVREYDLPNEGMIYDIMPPAMPRIAGHFHRGCWPYVKAGDAESVHDDRSA